MNPSGRALGRSLAVLGAATAAAGCLPAPATTEGRDIASLYTLFMGLALVVALVVTVPLTISILRFRRGRRPDRLPPQTVGHQGLEIAWTALPALLVAGLFVATFLVFTRVQATSAPRTTEIDVTAYRWGWSFRYPTEDVTVEGIGDPGPEVAVPVGEPVTIRLGSADVIHSFYVPEFLFKRDATPGHQTEFQFTVEEAGSYRGQCAEFCGVYHARMPFSVLAMSRPDYEAWLARTRAVQSVPPSISVPSAGPTAPASSAIPRTGASPSPALSGPPSNQPTGSGATP